MPPVAEWLVSPNLAGRRKCALRTQRTNLRDVITMFRRVGGRSRRLFPAQVLKCEGVTCKTRPPSRATWSVQVGERGDARTAHLWHQLARQSTHFRVLPGLLVDAFSSKFAIFRGSRPEHPPSRVTCVTKVGTMEAACTTYPTHQLSRQSVEFLIFPDFLFIFSLI